MESNSTSVILCTCMQCISALGYGDQLDLDDNYDQEVKENMVRTPNALLDSWAYLLGCHLRGIVALGFPFPGLKRCCFANKKSVGQVSSVA